MTKKERDAAGELAYLEHHLDLLTELTINSGTEEAGDLGHRLISLERGALARMFIEIRDDVQQIRLMLEKSE